MTNFASMDLRIVEFLAGIRDAELVAFFILITKLGNWEIVLPLSALASLLLIVKKRLDIATGLGVSLTGSFLTATVLQLLIARARPPEELRIIIENSYAFPSRHATVAIALYGFLIYVVLQLVSARFARNVLITILVALIALIGFSRIYLGVHYPVDVLGGYLVGLLFALIGVSVSQNFDAILARVPIFGRLARLFRLR